MADLVLIVDDDIAVQNMLTKVLRSSGLDSVCASSAEEALALLDAGLQKTQKSGSAGPFDLILMDINMRGMDGFSAVENIRRKGIKTPVIIVSGRNAAGSRQEDFDTLYGLDIGADDYISKPFNPVTLGAKVKALIRRSKNSLPGSEQMIVAGPFTYNTSNLRLYKGETEIQLSAKENAMMKLFMDNVGRIFSKDMLYEMIWGEVLIDENAVMVYISRLRQKIEDDPASPKFIQNVRGIGYRFLV